MTAPRYAESLPTVTAPVALPELEPVPRWHGVVAIVGAALAVLDIALIVLTVVFS